MYSRKCLEVQERNLDVEVNLAGANLPVHLFNHILVYIFIVYRASCYDGSVLGSQGAELLHCDYGITQQWLLEATTQPCWDSGSDDTRTQHTDYRQQFGFSTPLSTTDPSSASPSWIDNDSWNDKEKGLLEKGLVKMYT
jgi:hypothetical protein